MLPVNVRVSAQVEGVAAPVSLTTAASAALELERRIQLKGNYYLPDAAVLPPLYQASASIGFAPGRNHVTFEYDQPLAAVEEDRGYFRDGRMVSDFFYVLWPLKEWSRTKDFSIDLRIDVERVPPSWWRRTFGHPVNVACGNIRGRRAQIAGKLVYRTVIGDPFPDFLNCRIGDDDRVHE